MAIVGSSDIASQLAQYFKPDIINAVYRACPEAAFIRAEPGGGKNVQWDVRFGDAVPGSGTQNEGADVVAFRNDVYVPATLQYANFYEPFALTEKAIMTAAANGGAGSPAPLMNLARRALLDAAERLAANFAYQIYNGAGTTNNLWGLYAAGAPAIGDVGVYANIDPATYTQWVGNVFDGSGLDLDTGVMRSIRQLARTRRGIDPDLYVTDTIQFDKLAASYDAQRRYVETVTEITRADGARITIDGGVKMLSFEGARVIWSRNHPAGAVTALNTRRLHIEQLPDAPDSPGQTIAVAGTPDDNEGGTPFQLTARVKRLAELGDARKFSLFMYPALVVDDRGAHVMCTGLNS